MYARSTDVRGRPELVDTGIAEVRDTVMPAVQQMRGFIGLSMLTDSGSGRCIVTTAWHDAEALRDSRSQVSGLRRRAAELLGGPDPEVTEWEIPVLHREHHAAAGACARVTWLQVPVERVEQQIDAFRMRVLPQLQELPGFSSASLVVDRGTGRAAGAVVYASRDALAGSREATKRIRSETAAAVGADVLDVAEFDLALAHLRVPETV